MLSMPATSMLGSRLNCISAMNMPPNAESMVRFRRSVRCGSALRRASAQATCGQTNPWYARSAHASGGAWCS